MSILASQFKALMREREPFSIARDIVASDGLRGLVPVMVPERGSIVPPLACQIERTKAYAENLRRLRTSVWCEHVFRRVPAAAALAERLASFHRSQWRIARVANEGEQDALGNVKSELEIEAVIQLLMKPLVQAQGAGR